MTSADFIAFKNFVLEQNTYFNAGFANAIRMPQNNQILAPANNGEYEAIFPADTYANYFYLRGEGDIKYQAQEKERLTDSGKNRLTFQDTATFHIVAIVNDADALKLVENLRTTAMAYTVLSAIPISANYNRESVVNEEMKDMDKKVIIKALQNMSDQTIVRVTLAVNKTFIPGCIINPCKDCNS